MARRAALRVLYLALLPVLVLLALVLVPALVVSSIASQGRVWRPETWKKISYGSRYFRSSFRGRLGEVVDVIDVVRDRLILLFLLAAAACSVGGLAVYLIEIGVPAWLSAWLDGSFFSFLSSELA
jgi:hypothetical protein